MKTKTKTKRTAKKPTLCSHCAKRPRRAGGRYCLQCHAKAEKAAREIRREQAESRARELARAMAKVRILAADFASWERRIEELVIQLKSASDAVHHTSCRLALEHDSGSHTLAAMVEAMRDPLAEMVARQGRKHANKR